MNATKFCAAALSCLAVSVVWNTEHTFVYAAPASRQAHSRQCGKSIVQQTRLIGGRNATSGAFPWQAAITLFGIFKCGGVLVGAEWVASAAHCIAEPHPNFYIVTLGVVVLDTNAVGQQRIGVSKIIKHPRYDNPTLYNNDIVLLKLSKPVMFTKAVQPVCLPDQNKDLPVASLCHLTGWGKTSHPGNVVQILQQISLKVINRIDCLMKNNKIAPITDQMICAANFKPQLSSDTACHGDSGSPLVSKDTGGSWVLHGIVSWGSDHCNTTDAYTVFARTSEFRSWIDNTIYPKKVIIGT